MLFSKAQSRPAHSDQVKHETISDARVDRAREKERKGENIMKQ